MDNRLRATICEPNLNQSLCFENRIDPAVLLLLQKPLLLQGHDRSITQIKYNREGDLLFSCSKDSTPNVWWAANGERLGTYNGHQGAVWCLDVDWTTTRMMTGSGDMTTK